MASSKQIAANRHNAKRSTGPRTPKGKERSSQNSYKHGFSSAMPPSPEIDAKAEKLARDLVEAQNWLPPEDARIIAESLLGIAAVRGMKREIIEMVLSVLNREMQSEVEINKLSPQASTAPRTEVDEVDEASQLDAQDLAADGVSEIYKLDRYERHYAAERDRTLRKVIRARRRR